MDLVRKGVQLVLSEPLCEEAFVGVEADQIFPACPGLPMFDDLVSFKSAIPDVVCVLLVHLE